MQCEGVLIAPSRRASLSSSDWKDDNRSSIAGFSEDEVGLYIKPGAWAGERRLSREGGASPWP